MSEALGKLLDLQRKMEGVELAEYPEIDGLLRLAKTKATEAVTRIVPERILGLEKEHGWSKQFHQALETYEQRGLFNGGEKNALMSGKEVRDAAPNIGDVLKALDAHPELLAKVEQGFTMVHPVPFGLSPTAFKEPMGRAISQYHGEGKLRSSDGTKLKLDASEPAWMWDAYENADESGALVYSPERFDPKNHGGKKKQQILEASQFPGWQVLLTENMQTIPRQGKGQTVGGRKQIEAYQTAHQYLALLQSEGHALEQGLTPEAWQAMFLTRLAETDGQVLDDYQDPNGAACYCTGAYFPASGVVPCAYWSRGFEQAFVGRGAPVFATPDVGARAGVRVL